MQTVKFSNCIRNVRIQVEDAAVETLRSGGSIASALSREQIHAVELAMTNPFNHMRIPWRDLHATDKDGRMIWAGDPEPHRTRYSLPL